MCYSKEVQLITALTILLFCLFFYLYYSRKLKIKWQRSFLKYIVLMAICIGGHQFFEFLSLITNNEIIYKIGLIISISSMYFVLRSLEVLINKNIHSKIALYVIGVFTLYIFLTPVTFKGTYFYLSHNSGFLWSCAWMLLFIYWNINALQSIKNENSRKTMILYLLCAVDISFMLSAIYTILAYLRYSINVCSDAPSIWCTFFVVQVFFIPLFLSSFIFMFKRPRKKTKNTIKKTLVILLISLIILGILVAILPFFKCLTWKFVFP